MTTPNEKIVDIHCAQPTGGVAVDAVTILIHTPGPDLRDVYDWEQAYRDMYAEQGNTLAEALCGSLPGGTIDALLVDLLDRKRSLFTGPLFVTPKAEKEEASKVTWTAIRIKDLTEKDGGRWVKYHPAVGPCQTGRIKAWSEIYVFVVYNCDDNWDRYQEYTAAATEPGELEFIPAPDEDVAVQP